MASIEKTNQLQAFSSESVSRLWQDTEHYLSFLKTSARLYKYGFADQVLIHAHRPDAVACAEYATWSNKEYPNQIKALENRIAAYEKDFEHIRSVKAPDEGISPMVIVGKAYTDKETAGEALASAMKTVKSTTDKYNIGSYKGFDMYLSYSSFGQQFTLDLKREGTHSIVLGDSNTGNITRIENALDSIEKRIESSKEQLKMVHEQREEAKAELAKPFAREQELAEKSARLAQLNAELNIDAGANGSDISADEKPSLLGEISNIKKLSKEKKDKDKGIGQNPEKGDTAKGDDRRAI